MKTPIDKIWMKKFFKEFEDMLQVVEVTAEVNERPRIKQFLLEYGKAKEEEAREEAIKECIEIFRDNKIECLIHCNECAQKTGSCSRHLGIEQAILEGINNVIIGTNAGRHMTTANECLIVGEDAGPDVIDQDNQIRIGHGARADGGGKDMVILNKGRIVITKEVFNCLFPLIK